MARGSIPAPGIDMNPGIKPAVRDILALMAKALSGDMVLVVTPATGTPAPVSATWAQTFYIELQTAAGEVHSWFNKAVSSGHSVGQSTSGGGTVSAVPATTTTFVNGLASVVMTGSVHVWSNGNTATLTVAQLVVLGYTLSAKTGVLTFTTPA